MVEISKFYTFKKYILMLTSDHEYHSWLNQDQDTTWPGCFNIGYQ